MMDVIPMARYIDMNNIRYSVLEQITNETFKGSNINEINLYIDMNSVLKILYGNLNYDIKDYSSITSSIINMCSHYRHFFRSRYKVWTKIYLVNSDNLCKINKQLVYGYNSGFEKSKESNKMARDVIFDNMDLLRTLVPYLPDIYFVDTTFETGVLIYDIMCRDDMSNKKAHIIMTKDPYNYQLASMKPNTVILRRKDKDTSTYITKSNLFNYYFKERKIKRDDAIISPELFTALLALSSLKQRNIKTVASITKALTTIEQCVRDHRFPNMYNSDIDNLWRSILMQGGIKATPGELISRFKALDIQFLHSIFMESPERDYSDRIVNLNDPDAVRAINNKYFKANPLDLNNL